MDDYMVKQTVDFLVIFNFILLIGLVVVLRRLKAKGKLNDNKLAIILNGYFSFSFITISIPLFTINIRVAFIIDTVFLLILWVVGYPWIRWLYRKFSSRNNL
jgi:hypothetical protein